MKLFKLPKPLKTFIPFLIIFSLGIGIGYQYVQSRRTIPQQAVEKNTPKAFISEIYDKIKENYWNNISDAELLDLFKLSIEKNGGSSEMAKFENKDKLLNSFNKAITGMNDEQKNKFTAAVAGTVLASLAPAGRSGLYTQQNEQQLKNTVENINPEKDLYKDLGLKKGASEAAVITEYQQKAEQLKKDNSPEAQEKLKQITYAKEVLANKDKKENYDKKGVEPTIFSKITSPGILYMQFNKFSPTSLEEFQKAFESYEQVLSSGNKNDPTLTALILDLRGNVGGAIDATAYFLGFFLGRNQYAFDFYHKGEFLPFKSLTDKLPSVVKYKQIVVLIDNNTQSSAELMAASLKKYHVGILLGVPTKGWGTVEKVFPLDNQIDSKQKYSLFLVHSITLRDDNQPIEGRGVEPDVNIKNPDWEQQLFTYFRNPQLTQALKTLL